MSLIGRQAALQGTPSRDQASLHLVAPHPPHVAPRLPSGLSPLEAVKGGHGGSGRGSFVGQADMWDLSSDPQSFGQNTAYTPTCKGGWPVNS